MKKKILIIAIVIGVVVAIGLRLAGNAQVAKTKAYLPDLEKAVMVQVQSIQKTSFDMALSYSGTFTPNREIQLMPLAQGEVTGVYFSEGNRVTAGQTLLKVDDAMLQSQMIAAKAAYENAQSNYERYKSASGSEGITKMQLDGSLLQMRSAESQYKQLKIALDKCQFKAPFSGTITQRTVEIGSIAGATPVGRLTDVSSLKLEVNVPESDILYFTTGQSVEVTTDLYPDKTFKGKVDYVSSRGDASHNYLIKVKVPNTDKMQLKAGMYGMLMLNKNVSASVLSIPRTALLGSVKKPQVYVVEDGKALLRPIVIGRNNGTALEVLSGLTQGERIVIGGQINLTDSCKVEISK